MTRLWVWNGQDWQQVSEGQPAELRRARNIAIEVASVLGLRPSTVELRVSDEAPTDVPGER